jgi:hypothetical protein
LETSLSVGLGSSVIAGLRLLRDISPIALTSLDSAIQHSSEIVCVHGGCGNSAEPRMFMDQRSHSRAHSPGDWLPGATVNLLEKVERCLARAKLNQLCLSASASASACKLFALAKLGSSFILLSSLPHLNRIEPHEPYGLLRILQVFSLG